MPLPETSSVVVSPPMSSSIAAHADVEVRGDADELAPLDALDVAAQRDRQRARVSARVSAPPKRWMPRPDITSTRSRADQALDALVLDGERDGDARGVAASIVAGSEAECTLRTTRAGPATSAGTAVTAHYRKQLLGERGRVGGGRAVARADVGERPAGVQRQLERRAGARGLVGVRERDVRRAERRERGGDLGGRGGAERRGQREVDLRRLERLQVGGERLDVGGRRARRRRRACRSA